MEVNVLVRKCVEDLGLDKKNLQDIFIAVSLMDRLHGSNQIDLDPDTAMCRASGEGWSEVLDILGFPAEDTGDRKIPYVQQLRLVSDVLTLALHSKISGLGLMMPESHRAARGVKLAAAGYADEDACIANLSKIEEYVLGQSEDMWEYEEMYRRVAGYRDVFQEMGCWNSSLDKWVCIPPGAKNLGYGRPVSASEFLSAMGGKSVSEYKATVLRDVCMMQSWGVLKYIMKSAGKAKVHTNLALAKAVEGNMGFLPMCAGRKEIWAVAESVPAYMGQRLRQLASEDAASGWDGLNACICMMGYMEDPFISKEGVEDRIFDAMKRGHALIDK